MIVLWEQIQCQLVDRGLFSGGISPMLRAKVPGGWFVKMQIGNDAFFYPDPEHLWDGSSLP